MLGYWQCRHDDGHDDDDEVVDACAEPRSLTSAPWYEGRRTKGGMDVTQGAGVPERI